MAQGTAAFAQGSVRFDNSHSAGRLAFVAPGNPYGGVFGLEVWELNATTVPANINGLFPTIAYSNLVADGFKLERTFANQNNAATPGLVALGELDMFDVSPPGSTAVLALVAWTGAARDFWSFLNNPIAPACAGVLAFVNPTADFSALPAPDPPYLTGWNSDLVMVYAVPEPAVPALAALGAAAFLIFGRRGGGATSGAPAGACKCAKPSSPTSHTSCGSSNPAITYGP
jgi:hypothetical protein